MPQKPQKSQKWGLKVWCLADAKSKYVANFEVYCGKDSIVEEEIRRPRGEAWLAYNVVLRLVSPYEDKEHVITMDNFFSSIPLFKELLERRTYATGTIQCNRVGLSDVLKNAKVFKKSAQGTLEWRMHESRKLSAIMWKDKNRLLLFLLMRCLFNFLANIW